jgi:hypothetical protein
MRFYGTASKKQKDKSLKGSRLKKVKDKKRTRRIQKKDLIDVFIELELQNR